MLIFLLKRITISFLFLSFLSCFLFAEPQPTATFNSVKLGKVIDGDTFKVNLNCKYKIFCKAISVRVRGINTPELNAKDPVIKKKAQKAKQFTKGFLSRKKIKLKECSRGKYFRLVCDVYANKESLAEALLAKELAVPYENKTSH